MRLAAVTVDGRRLAAVERDGDLYALAVPAGTDLAAVLTAGPAAVREAVAGARERLAGAQLEAPLRPGKTVAVGLNYLDHIREAGMERPERPLLFAKFPSSVIGPEQPIVIDAGLTERVDWEVELAVIVGAPMRHVSPAEAMAGVAG